MTSSASAERRAFELGLAALLDGIERRPSRASRTFARGVAAPSLASTSRRHPAAPHSDFLQLNVERVQRAAPYVIPGNLSTSVKVSLCPTRDRNLSVLYEIVLPNDHPLSRDLTFRDSGACIDFVRRLYCNSTPLGNSRRSVLNPE